MPSRAAGEFAGERTVAAYVWRISDHSAKRGSSSSSSATALGQSSMLVRTLDKSAPPSLTRRSRRVLRMEVGQPADR